MYVSVILEQTATCSLGSTVVLGFGFRPDSSHFLEALRERGRRGRASFLPHVHEILERKGIFPNVKTSANPFLEKQKQVLWKITGWRCGNVTRGAFTVTGFGVIFIPSFGLSAFYNISTINIYYLGITTKKLF
jgi:hypothetical protein